MAALCLAAALSFGAIGIAYARGSGTGKVDNQCLDGDALVRVASNDPNGANDPAEAGAWTTGTNPVWSGARISRDIASTSAIFSRERNSIKVTSRNAYPGYLASVLFSIKNDYQSPITVAGIKISPEDFTDEIEVRVTGVSEGQIINSGETADGALQLLTKEIEPGSACSYTINFKFLVTKPGVPVLSAPADDTITGMTPTLSWLAAAGASTYSLQVSPDPDFDTLVVNQPLLTALSYSIKPGALKKDTVYYWRVRAGNYQGTSNWSTAWSFTAIRKPENGFSVSK